MAKQPTPPVTFTLLSTTMTPIKGSKREGKLEELYHYKGSDNTSIKFHAHPTRAFEWCITECEPPNRKLAFGLVDAYTVAGSRAATLGGKEAFEKAIQTLTV